MKKYLIQFSIILLSGTAIFAQTGKQKFITVEAQRRHGGGPTATYSPYEPFMKTAGKYLDIVSNNYYNYWTPDSTQMANWTKWTGKPFIVTEYYTKGEDSGMPNQSGAGWIVRTQRDRGLFYQNYNLALIESKNCVGWHYFKYQDNDPTAKGADQSNTDANKGIVNNYYEVWTPMMDLMKQMNTQIYHLISYFDK